MDVAPCILEQTSLTIKPNPFIHPLPILSSHQYLDFVHSLSLTQCHAVASFVQHICHITTFHMHFHIWCSHTYSLATPVSVHWGDACATSPPFVCNTPAHNPLQSHTDTHLNICNIHSPVFTHPPRPVLLFIHPISCSHAGSCTSICTHWVWAHIQPEMSYFHSSKNFLAMFCSPVLSVWQMSLFMLGSI